ncbi:FAD-dependent monooxygenase [Dactylosporangium sp. NBC_01737]|uniref:FAD-dependent monooxygenase n=1 Tax=Dactylosporangium sp. NBC_01737 TaxID=2975959 RepID=UPI002E0FD33E|nr:FAD-dependent monooxygenase [Dactylosporangium sp. NBC_01737]
MTSRIVVIGSGIGGLTAAIALLAEGHEVEVYDQATTFGAIGAGVSLGANGSRLMERLGLGPALREVGSDLHRIQFHEWRTGELFYEHPMGDWYTDRFGAPFLGLHRADLQQVLLDAFRAGGGEVRLGRRCVAIDELPDGVDVTFADGTSTRADVLIGADGVRSTVRQHVAGPDEAVFAGMSCFRGLVPVDRVPGGDQMGLTFFLGPVSHLVVYPVRRGELINFVAYTRDEAWTDESWSAKGDASQAVAAFEGFNDTVLAMLGAVQDTGRWALFDREPLRQWSTGRVTLLGDAAHPMLPHAGQGSNQAVEDVAVLAHFLGQPDLKVGEALAAYETVRKPRARQLQIGSRGNAKCFQVPDGPEAQARNERLANLPDMVSWIHGYDAHADLRAAPEPAV